MIVNFDENMKSNKRISDNILEMTNYLYDSKLTGTNKKEQLEKIVVLEGKLFSNLLKRGKRNEDDLDSFETLIPSKYKEAKEMVKEQNTDALLQVEMWNRNAQPTSEYSYGFRR